MTFCPYRAFEEVIFFWVRCSIVSFSCFLLAMDLFNIITDTSSHSEGGHTWESQG